MILDRYIRLAAAYEHHRIMTGGWQRRTLSEFLPPIVLSAFIAFQSQYFRHASERRDLLACGISRWERGPIPRPTTRGSDVSGMTL